MHICPEDLEGLISEGAIFEKLLYDLVAVEIFRHTLPHHAVSWDPSIHRGDGGRDILITQEHHSVERFIPRKRSVWSAKSGKPSLNRNTLRRELSDPAHEPLRKHLDAGWVYVWCTPLAATHDITESFKNEFTAITRADGTARYSPEQIIVYSACHLADALNQYPFLIAKHFPHLPKLFQGCRPISEWNPSTDSGLHTPYVSSASRQELIERIQDHFLSYDDRAVLHLAGLSGVGKSRAAYEAITDRPEFASALYVMQYDHSVRDTIRNLKARNAARLLLVLDEVPMADYSQLSREFDSDAQVRIITIGPAPRDHTSTSGSVLIMPPPETATDVLPVLEAACNVLTKTVLASIAERASHDLRLGLLLTRATLCNPDFMDLPVPDGDEMWRRICWLNRQELAHIRDFQNLYPLLTLAIDVGYANLDKEELNSIARFFEVPPATLLEVLLKAHDVGLGVCTPHFFEAGPRALAIHLFQHIVFSRVHLQFRELMRSISSDRLKRRIIERCHELTGESRRKADEVVTAFFSEELGGNDITQLTTFGNAAKYIAWAELDPTSALRWLQKSLESASDAHVSSLDGTGASHRGPSPRRRIVWLCESWASFGQHFMSCESLLFRLASAETEHGIANNSTGVWKGLFLPVLAFTEVPFPTRAELLLSRLRDANSVTAPIVVDAVIAALASYFGGRCAPPTVVGGYLAPPPWMPKTPAELRALQVDLATRYLDMVQLLPAETRSVAIKKAVERLDAFHRLGVLQRLKKLLALHGNVFLIEARRNASTIIMSYNREDVRTASDRPGSLQELLAFEAELGPTTLLQRIESVTTRHTWDMTERSKWDATADTVDPYADLAAAIAAEPLVLAQCRPLFSSARVQSDSALGLACGIRDDADVHAATAESWLRAGVCIGFLSGYLQGVANRCAGLPLRWSEQLDALACTYPQMVADLTLAAQQTATGLSRLFVLVSDGSIQPACMFRLAFSTWTRAVEEVGRANVVTALFQAPDQVRGVALATALKLGQVWGNFGERSFDGDLNKVFGRVLSEAIGGTREADAWVDVLTSLGMTSPLMALDLATQGLVQDRSGYSIPTQLILPVLKKLAVAHPAECIASVGALLLSSRHRVLFGLLKFDGLFDAIGVDVIREWTQDKDATVVAMIARHADGPSSESGNAVVPALADWLFQTHGVDSGIFKEFCAGRHAFEIRGGSARERRGALDSLVEPFRHDQREWIQRWIQYEERLYRAEEQWHAVHEEDIDRR